MARVDLEAVVRAAFDLHRDHMHGAQRIAIGDIAGPRGHHPAARRETGQQREDERGRGTAGQQDSLRIEIDTVLIVIMARDALRSEEHTSELQSLMRISYAVFCLK